MYRTRWLEGTCTLYTVHGNIMEHIFLSMPSSTASIEALSCSLNPDELCGKSPMTARMLRSSIKVALVSLRHMKCLT